jgi:RNA polymerase sigma-70 factor (ECF subfamily)
MESDPIDVLIATSGLGAPSRQAVHSAWEQLVSDAREEWPQLKLDLPKLAKFVGERVAGADLVSALSAAPAADLALAGACTALEPTAQAAFDALLAEVNAAGATTGASKDQVEEAKQLLRVQLLVAKDGKPPQIAGYRGKGSLRGWLRITATRELIRLKKKHAREEPTSKGFSKLGEDGDPALENLKAEYRAEFASALRQAITDLSPEDRTLLRQQIADGMSIDEVGAAFGVHRATAARWLNRARGALVSATHRRLAERLKLPVDEVESVIRMVQSKLDASVVRYLREDDHG